jgi:hypothetical protein
MPPEDVTLQAKDRRGPIGVVRIPESTAGFICKLHWAAKNALLGRERVLTPHGG